MELDFSFDDYPSLFNYLKTDEESFNFAKKIGLIRNTFICDCGNEMELKEKKNAKYKVHFVCKSKRKVCRKEKSVLSETWFSKTRLDIKQGILLIICYTTGNLTYDQLGFFTGIKSNNTLSNWKNYMGQVFRDEYKKQKNKLIGGIKKTVEIDETCIYRRKSNKGRLLNAEKKKNKKWVVGGICRETGEVFMCLTKKRNSKTLEKIITKYVKPGTLIITDGWKGYNGLNKIGYKHRKVNHKKNFLDPKNKKINTQKIERLWRTLKMSIPKGSRYKERINYINEFIFKINKNWFNLKILERFKIFIELIKNTRFY